MVWLGCDGPARGAKNKKASKKLFLSSQLLARLVSWEITKVHVVLCESDFCCCCVFLFCLERFRRNSLFWGKGDIMYIGSSVVVQTVTALYVSISSSARLSWRENLNDSTVWELFCHLFSTAAAAAHLSLVYAHKFLRHSTVNVISNPSFVFDISSPPQRRLQSTAPTHCWIYSIQFHFPTFVRLDCFRTSRNEFSVSELSKTSKPSMRLLCHSCSSIHHHCIRANSVHINCRALENPPSTTLSYGGRVDLPFDDSLSLIHEIKYWWNHTIKHTKLLCCCRAAMMMFDDDDGDGMYVWKVNEIRNNKLTIES